MPVLGCRPPLHREPPRVAGRVPAVRDCLAPPLLSAASAHERDRITTPGRSRPTTGRPSMPARPANASWDRTYPQVRGWDVP
ncbi:hypothetical protein GCM10018779_66710 [Streptomyces griseocarneus]|nr:hypothetical protein GCM10018779_66710 [Streptomyces griseocarneus]